MVTGRAPEGCLFLCMQEKGNATCSSLICEQTGTKVEEIHCFFAARLAGGRLQHRTKHTHLLIFLSAAKLTGLVEASYLTSSSSKEAQNRNKTGLDFPNKHMKIPNLRSDLTSEAILEAVVASEATKWAHGVN